MKRVHIFLSTMLTTFFRKKRVYLDHAGATMVSARAKRAHESVSHVYGNPSGIHKEGADARKVIDRARAMCATILNAHSYEIYFVSSGTESCNTAVLGTYHGYTKRDEDHSEPLSSQVLPHVITSSIEHPSVLEPIKKLEREKKIRVTYLPVYSDGIVKGADVREALCEDTMLVSVMYANNEIGTVQPVKEIGRIIEEWKTSHGRTHTSYPYFHIDACQAANYCNLDVVRLRAHLMTVNSGKVYGPKGIALLYKREGIMLDPIVYGGGQERGLRSGTESPALSLSFATALTDSQEMKTSEVTRLQMLNDYCRSELAHAIPSIVFYGAFDSASPSGYMGRVNKDMRRLPNNINCSVPGISSEEMILRLDAKGFAVSHKSACASMETDGSYVVMALGASEEEAKENIRISMGRSTKMEDMASFVRVVKEIATKYKK